jgi:hypothetical protein
MTRQTFSVLMIRWPRTLMVGTVLLGVPLVIGVYVGSTYLLGRYGPVYLGVVWLFYIVVSAVRGDMRDRKKS